MNWPEAEEQPASAPSPDRRSTFLGDSLRGLRRRLLFLAGLGVFLAILLYYPVGAWRVHVIDDNPSFAPPEGADGRSDAVAMAAALIRREIDTHGWTPNKPMFLPAAILVDMPAFQKGIDAAVACFATEMSQHIGRLPEGSSGEADVDADLERAAQLMSYSPSVWMIDPTTPWVRVLSTEKQYRNAARAFEAYNTRLIAKDATFDRRAPALAALLDGMIRELDVAADQLDPPIDAAHGWFSRQSSDAFYGSKGRAYAALLLLRAAGEDFRPVLAERALDERWQTMLTGLAAAALPNPWLVLDGGPTAVLIPNHLALQGYHLLRARAMLARLAEGLR